MPAGAAPERKKHAMVRPPWRNLRALPGNRVLSTGCPPFIPFCPCARLHSALERSLCFVFDDCSLGSSLSEIKNKKFPSPVLHLLTTLLLAVFPPQSEQC